MGAGRFNLGNRYLFVKVFRFKRLLTQYVGKTGPQPQRLRAKFLILVALNHMHVCVGWQQK
jgi:hypothetical protein